MNHYAIAPYLLLDYAKHSSYNVFCSICSTSFSLVIDLQNHLSVHLHLDVELRGGLIHYDANLMSSSIYGSLHQSEDTMDTSHGIDLGIGTSKGIILDGVEIKSGEEHEHIRITEEGDGSNSYPGGSENSDGFSVALNDTPEDTRTTDSTDTNEDSLNSYPNSVSLIKLDLKEQEDVRAELVSPQNIESTDDTTVNNFSCDSDDPREPFVRNFECSLCGQKFVNLQSCLSHYSKRSCFQNGLEVVKVVEAKSSYKEVSAASSSPTSSPAAPMYRCSTCDEKFSTIEEFSVHCQGHSAHSKFAADFHREQKRPIQSPKTGGSKRKATVTTTNKRPKKNNVKVAKGQAESHKALKDPFLYAYKEPDMLLCHTCNTQFKGMDSCCDHLKNLNSKPFICGLCGKLFKTEQVRDYHQKLPHVIPCSRCAIFFPDASSLALHNRAYHPVTPPEKEK